MNQIIKDISDAVKSVASDKTSAYDTQAEVIRIEGNTAWVHIYGGVDETPVALTIDAHVGDVVQVRVGGGRAWLTGNGTAPPTDDTTAIIARTEVREVQKEVETIGQIAGNTNQYFWHTQSGTDTGAHITEVPRETFLSDPSNGGGNLLARSNGVAVRDGLTEVSRFGAASLQLGQDGQSRQVMDYHSMQLISKEDETYFHVSDLRDTSGVYQFTDTIIANGSANSFWLTLSTDYNDIISVTVNGVAKTALTDYTLTTVTGNDSFPETRIEFVSTPAQNAEIIAVYNTRSQASKAYTLGTRKTGSKIGPFSYSEGIDNDVCGYLAHAEGRHNESHAIAHAEGSGTKAMDSFAHSEGANTEAWYCAHAEGLGSKASGNYSHAQNYYTIASSKDQTAIGKYNIEDTNSTYGFIMGNGTSNNARKNAFAVRWNGLVEAENVINYGTCATAAGTAQKKVEGIHSSFTLQTGAVLAVKFTNANSASNPTIEIDGTTNSIVQIMRYGTTVAGTSAASSWNAGSVVIFVYDGTYWQIANWLNTTYSSMSDAEISAGTGTSTRVITPARLKSAIWTWAPSAPSDRRLKEHINYIDEDNIIRRLKPVHYLRNGKDELGFYAQDVEYVDEYGALVGEDANGVKYLNYFGLIAPLVAYCQKLEQRIEKLEREK